MTFRTRLLVTFLLAVLIPMIVLALLIRNEMTTRLSSQYERRVDALVAVIEGDLAAESETITVALETVRQAVDDDNRLRRALVDGAQEERRYLLDYAARVMRLTGLSMLQIQDDVGRIVSSGHFRNEYDRLEPALPRLLASTERGTALVQVRSPDAPFLSFARVDSLRMGHRRFTIVAGLTVEGRFLSRLAREANLTVALVYPGGMLTSTESQFEPGTDAPSSTANVSHNITSPHAIVRELSLPYIDTTRGGLTVAKFRVAHELAELHTLRGSIDRWFLVAVAATGVLVAILVSWLTSRISRPLVELADKTSRIDWDRLDIEFKPHGNDEIGILSKGLGAMTERLRASALLIKDAERRATLGEMARQVNHDIKNGLTPIRNVFRHLLQLANDDPKRLPEVFHERRSTLDSSIDYLENLASNYARLSPKGEHLRCDVNQIIKRVVADRQGSDQATLRMDLGDGAFVLGDPLSLRRVVENLVDNAIDSLESQHGKVAISTALVSGDNNQRWVRIAVTDTGVGMNEAQRSKAFDAFYTTKHDGTGLGLSIVRRLVIDLGGVVDFESEPGKGSRFVIDVPAESGV